MLKTCTKCGRELDTSCFAKDIKSKDGLTTCCKECRNAYKREYDSRPEVIERKKKYNAEYLKRPGVAEKQRLYSKQYDAIPENKEKKKLRTERYYKENKEHILQYRKEYNQRPEVQQRKRKYSKEYNQRPEVIVKRKQAASSKAYKQTKNERNRQRRITDSCYKLDMNMCSLLNSCLSIRKTSPLLFERCGYTIDELKQHIESQFTPEMSWNNYGSYWELDHIIPRSYFYYETVNDSQFKICWSLLNLRPISVKENASRPKDGSDIPDSIKQQILNQFKEI